MGGFLRSVGHGLARTWSWWMRDIQSRKSTGGKLASVGIGLFVLCCLASIVVGTVRNTGEAVGLIATRTPSPQPTASPTLVSSATAAPTNTAAPTATTGPTNTPVLTNTPRPTNTPAPTETPVPSTATPAPIVLEGRGQAVTDPFSLPFPVSRIKFTHQGRRNFVVKIYKADGSGEDLLVNTIGNYAGARPVIGDTPYFLEIDADGAWTATVEPLGFDDGYAGGAEGSGDGASPLFTPQSGAVPFTFTHNGDRNFAVWLRCAGGDDLLQNEIGAFQGQAVVRFTEGPCFWDVTADGAWSIMPK